ncbi:MAG: GNAT family N-acetyltransferase [Oscillospiraceae bacterium]|nr:GNAT family N-acetyltransferase [Oscillospiraceae bacterium]
MHTPIDLSNTTLETERLVLRPWREEDLPDLFAYASVPGVGEMAGWRHHESMEESQAILSKFISAKNFLALEHKATKKVIGSLGLHDSWADDEPSFAGLKIKEIGYVLAKEFWGQGLMPEAVREVLRFCFEDCGLDAVSIGHFAENAQSRRVIEKCGFRFISNGTFFAKQLGKTFEDMKYILYK